MNYIKAVIKLIQAKNYTISFAESITGGLLASKLVKFPGISKNHLGSVITYSEDAKIKLLNVLPTTIRENSVVSDAVAFEMCDNLSKLFSATINVAITGNAGPSFDKNTNKLESYLCIKHKENFIPYHLTYDLNKREKVLDKLVKVVYKLLYSLLNNEG